jgi:hypothetical protein
MPDKTGSTGAEFTSWLKAMLMPDATANKAAAHWRARAQAARDIAEAMPQPGTKRRLLELAVEYDDRAAKG